MKATKKILIMRHAKSSRADISQKDFDRSLSKRGKFEAPAMGRYLKNLGIIPDHIVSSPARRARQTVLHLSAVFDLDKEKITWNEDLYYKDAQAYMQSIRNAPAGDQTLLIAGHNPSVEQIVGQLSGDNSHLVITTANIACFESDAVEWSGVEKENCSFKWLAGPKDIKKS